MCWHSSICCPKASIASLSVQKPETSDYSCMHVVFISKVYKLKKVLWSHLIRVANTRPRARLYAFKWYRCEVAEMADLMTKGSPHWMLCWSCHPIGSSLTQRPSHSVSAVQEILSLSTIATESKLWCNRISITALSSGCKLQSLVGNV